MRVVCDQCSATYKVPNEKLTKPINKASCRSCGARLLIPKPQPGADPEERVVVPAIPATSGVGDQGMVAPAEEDDSDKTMPVVRKPKAPAPAPAPLERDDISFEEEESLPTTVQRRPPEIKVERSAKPAPRPAPAEPRIEAPAKAAPAAPAPRAPAAAPSAGGGASGLGFAFAGAVMALLGTLLLSVPLGTLAQAAGIFLGITGSVTAMLALAISNFGQKDAMGPISLVVGLVLGAMMAVGLPLAGQSLQGGVASGGAVTASTQEGGPEEAKADGGDAEPAADEGEAKADDDGSDKDDDKSSRSSRSSGSSSASSSSRSSTSSAGSATTSRAREPEPEREPVRSREPEPEPEPVRTREPEPEPVRSREPEPRRTPSTERDVIEPEPDPDPEPLPPARSTSSSSSRSSGGSSAPEPGSSDGLMTSVPPEIIQTIVTTNVGVKRCFYEALKSREIAKPITVNTTFNLSASGSASNLRVKNTELRGSNLERCLDTAFRSMSFPPAAKGGPVNFPFKL